MKQQSRNRVGVLHSLMGTMASAEMHLKDATRFLLQAICISTIWFLCWLRQVFLLPKCKFQSVVIIFLSLIIQVYLPSSVLAASEDANDIKRVLVVNSYHPGYSWSDDVMNGVRDVLEKEKGVEVFIEYLDTKRNTEETYLRQMERLILYKYENKDLDAIITSDDSALDLMLGIKEEYFSNVPLVFCGVDRDIERVSGFNSIYAVTGSKEGIRSTLDLVLSLHPNIETVFFVSDESKTGRAKLETVRKMQPAYKETVRFDYLLNKSSGELQTALRQLPKKSVVFNLVFIRDALQKTFSIEEGVRLIGNNAKCLFIAHGDFSLVPELWGDILTTVLPTGNCQRRLP